MMNAFFGKSLALLGVLGTVSLAADYLPNQAIPLSKVLTTLEQQGLSPIVEADFDDGVWEIEGFRGGKPVELHVDPMSGKVLDERPDRIDSRPAANAKPASEIARLLEAAGYAPVMQLDWEHTFWKAEAVSSQGHRELQVTPDTGKVVSDRADD